MSVIYLGAGTRVKTYATKARARGGAIISIEIEATDPSGLSYLIHELEEIRAEQMAAEKAAGEERGRAEKEEAARRSREKRRPARGDALALEALPAPLLLSFRESDDHD